MSRRLLGLLLVLPALAVIAFLFILPLVMSAVGAFRIEGGGFGWDNFYKTFDLYTKDIVFSVVIITISTILIGLASIAIGGYLTLGEHPVAVAILRWLYRWPMFIPFIVVGQILRTFLAKSGLMNSTLISLGLLTPLDAQSYLDWRGIVIAFVWKQTPFVALLVAGAMASVNRDTIEAARNLGASKLRVLFEILVPQVSVTLTVGLILSFVTMMSVLSVPLMINAQSPTMLTADIAFRVNAYGDYGVANALGLVSLVLASSVAWIYLRQSLKERA
ncbi:MULTISPECIES: ABC transporter permease subunit [unclassified Rhizobium]|jgi:putative spermidine/putrescine transport system permease protein|uniref:ABC transporter permease n=1 Tax=unclassified Rhizobium TaxID=2613769 RepID=UPI000DDB8DC0|nr:ABC transporter permease subunit [Rhizobium sp. BG4]QRM46384.1 ABC transporter permease subunit [Rhizobium sp. BG4]